jgi:hypothetical protein
MAWTDPITWTGGQLVTETQMNTYIRDNMNYLLAIVGSANQNAGGNYINLDVGNAIHPISGLTGAGIIQAEIGTVAPIVNALLGSFISTSDTWLQWQGNWPNSAGTNVPHARGNFYMGTATSGTVVWGVHIAAISSGDSKVKTFNTVNLGTVAVPGTAGIFASFDITLTNNDSIAPNDSVIVGFYRETDDAADNAGGTAYFVSGEVK